MGKKKWYVVNTHSGYEQKARDALIKRIELLKSGEFFGEVLVPVETILETKKGKQKTSTRKFFPGYILVEMELTDETWHVVKDTPKISGFVGNTTRPTPMRASEVEQIKNRMEKSEEEPDLHQTLEEGDNVKVTEGPFSNFNGVIELIDVDKKRVRVLVSIFGRVVPVELEFRQVELLTAT